MATLREIYQRICLQVLPYSFELIKVEDLDNETGHELIVSNPQGVRETLTVTTGNIYRVKYKDTTFSFSYNYFRGLLNRSES